MARVGAARSDRESIVSTVAKADRRVRAARYVRGLIVGSTLVLYVSLVFAVIAHVLPIPLAIAWWIAAGGVPTFAAAWAWVLAREPALVRAAAALDAAASLRDELTSAYWFAQQPSPSASFDLHLSRAAGTAAALDLAQLVPVAVPRRAAAAGAIVCAALLAVSLVPVERTRTWARGAPVLSPAEQEQLQEVEYLLGTEQGRDPARAALRARIDELLRRLREGHLTPEETLALVEELRDLLGAAAGSDAARREVLARMGAALAASEAGERVGDPMRQGQIDLAAQRMRDLAAAVDAAMREGTLPGELQTALARAAAQPGLDALAADLANAVAQIGRRQPAGARSALERAAGELETIAREQEFEESLRNATARLDSLERSLGSRFGTPRDSGRTAQSGEQQMFPSQNLGPDAAQRLPGSGPGRPVATPGQPPQSATLAPSAQIGSSAPGPLGTPAVQLASETMRLQVARRREVLPAEPAPDEASRSRTVDQDTRATRPTVEYRPVATVPPYAEADPQTPSAVPWPYRDLVRSYFRLIGPRGEGARR